MCLLWVWKPRLSSSRLHDPISAILTAVLPEALGGVAAAAPEIAAATIPEVAAATIPEVVLPEVAVSALAPAVGIGDIAAATLPAVGSLVAGGAFDGADVGAIAPDASLNFVEPQIGQVTTGAPTTATGGAPQAGEISYTLTPQDLASFNASPQQLQSQAQAASDISGIPFDQALQQAQQNALGQITSGATINTPDGPLSIQGISVDPATGNFIASGFGPQTAAPDVAAATAPIAPADVQIALPPVDVGAAAPAVDVAAAAPALEPVGAFSSILNALNPISSAQAAEAPLTGVPSLSALGSTNAALNQVGNVETLLGGGTVPAQPALNLPSLPGAGGGGAASSELTGTLQPGGALTNIPGISTAPAAPGQAPPELASIDASGGTAGTAAAPPSAPPPATVDTSATSTPSTAGGGTATTTPTTTPTGTVGVQGQPLDTSGQPGATDTGGGAKAAASGGLLKDAKDWLKENSGILSAIGTIGGLGMSLFNKPSFPTQSAAVQATQPGQGAANQAFGNAVGAQAPANQAFKTAAQSVVPAAEQGIAQTVQTEAPLAKQQADLSAQLGASAQPLLSAATTGILPPGEADAIQSALDTSRATIEGAYGNLNLAGSTTEAQDIAASAANIRGQIPNILNQLVTQGIQEANASTGSAGAAGTANSTILNAIQGLTQALNAETGAAGGVTSAASGVTGASQAVTAAGEAAANTNLQVAQLQLQADQELQQALTSLGRNLALSQISPSTINVTG